MTLWRSIPMGRWRVHGNWSPGLLSTLHHRVPRVFDRAVSSSREAALRAATHQRPLLTIIGAPNVGKSTLFNRLVKSETSYTSFRPRALVSPIAGTTNITRFNPVLRR